MDNPINGKQTNDYFKQYYLKNKERIQKRNKAKYQADRSSPEKLLKHRAKSTEHTRNYRKRHPERVKVLRKKQYDTRKHRAFKLVSKTGFVSCNTCGCDEISFLEINHINGGGAKEHRNSGRIATVDRILKGERKTDDLNLLCRICNAWEYLAKKNEKQAQRFDWHWDE